MIVDSGDVDGSGAVLKKERDEREREREREIKTIYVILYMNRQKEREKERGSSILFYTAAMCKSVLKPSKGMKNSQHQ